MNNNPHISIIVPCYNEEKRLNKQAFINFAKKNPSIVFFVCK